MDNWAKGFSLVEVLVVLSLIIAAFLFISSIIFNTRKAYKQLEIKTIAQGILFSIVAHLQKNPGDYPKIIKSVENDSLDLIYIFCYNSGGHRIQTKGNKDFALTVLPMNEDRPIADSCPETSATFQATLKYLKFKQAEIHIFSLLENQRVLTTRVGISQLD